MFNTFYPVWFSLQLARAIFTGTKRQIEEKKSAGNIKV